MTTQAKPVPHIHAEVIKAWADGAEIEYRRNSLHSWKVTSAPDWSEYYDYRVKPAHKPDAVYFMALCDPSYVGDTGRSTIEGFASDVYNHVTDSLKLTFDGETGKLKKAEVL